MTDSFKRVTAEVTIAGPNFEQIRSSAERLAPTIGPGGTWSIEYAPLRESEHVRSEEGALLSVQWECDVRFTIDLG